jgi:hypothetical protein
MLRLAASFPCSKSPTQTGGVWDHATNVQFFKPNLLDLSGAVAPREEPAGVGWNRSWLCSCVLKKLLKCD